MQPTSPDGGRSDHSARPADEQTSEPPLGPNLTRAAARDSVTTSARPTLPPRRQARRRAKQVEVSNRAEPSRWRRRCPRSRAPLPASRRVAAGLISAPSAPQLRPARPRSGGWCCTPSRGAASVTGSRRSSTPPPCSPERPTPSRPSSSRQANLLDHALASWFLLLLLGSMY